MNLKTNWELTNKFVSAKNSIPDANSNYFMREQTQAINSINTNLNPIIKINNFDFTNSKTVKKFNYEYHLLE